MDSKKVKIIKEILENCADEKKPCSDCKYFGKCEKLLGKRDILTLINELERENERLLNEKWDKEDDLDNYHEENQQLKDRITELEKENKDYYDRLNNLQAYIDNHEEIWKGNTNNALKKFVERLKEISCEMYLKKQLHRCIDETLKEFTDEKV